MPVCNKTPVVVALSGGGRTLANLLEHEKSGKTHYHIAGVISSADDCRGNEIARSAGLPLFVGDFRPQFFSASHREHLAVWLSQLRAEWVALAGFIKLFPLDHDLRKRIINIHPALLPKYGGKGMYGMAVHRQVVKNGDRTSGATIHFVNEKYDEGSIIAQAEVEVPPAASPEDVASAVFAAECDLYPKVLDLLITNKLPMESGDIFRYQFRKNAP